MTVRTSADRGVVSLLAVLLLSTTLGAGRALAQFPPFMTPQETEQLAPGLYAFRQGAYRSIFLVSDQGVIATDPVSTKYAAAYRAEIAKLTDQPVRYVVYSQSQWDRTRGGKIFKDEGARFIAQAGCAENLRAVPHPDVVMPDVTFTDRYRVELGDQALDLYYFGPAHDSCMTVMVAKPANMLFVTNVVNPPVAAVPWNPTMANDHLYNYLPFFRAAEALAAREHIDTLVGGFMSVGLGPDRKPMVFSAAGPIAALTEQRIFWEKVMTAVEQALDAGVPPRQLAKKIDMEQFKAYSGYTPRNMEVLFRRVASMYITGR